MGSDFIERMRKRGLLPKRWEDLSKEEKLDRVLEQEIPKLTEEHLKKYVKYVDKKSNMFISFVEKEKERLKKLINESEVDEEGYLLRSKITKEFLSKYK